jgi:hypothetical protein
MEVLTKKTPFRRCMALAGFTSQMMMMHEDNPRLVAYGTQLAAGRIELSTAERGVIEAEERLMLVRVTVKFVDYLADTWLRRLHGQTQIFDGHKSGRLTTRLFPDGLVEITRRVGVVQVERMLGLEARLRATQDWAEAPAQLATLIQHRTRYEGALADRSTADNEVVIARANRDAVKERFLDLYAGLAGLVRSEFPRNRRMQNLFFEALRTQGRAVEEPDEDLPEEPEDGDTEG